MVSTRFKNIERTINFKKSRYAMLKSFFSIRGNDISHVPYCFHRARDASTQVYTLSFTLIAFHSRSQFGFICFMFTASAEFVEV